MNSNYGWQKFAAKSRQEQLRQDALLRHQLKASRDAKPAQSQMVTRYLLNTIFIIAGFILHR